MARKKRNNKQQPKQLHVITEFTYDGKPLPHKVKLPATAVRINGEEVLLAVNGIGVVMDGTINERIIDTVLFYQTMDSYQKALERYYDGVFDAVQGAHSVLPKEFAERAAAYKLKGGDAQEEAEAKDVVDTKSQEEQTKQEESEVKIDEQVIIDVEATVVEETVEPKEEKESMIAKIKNGFKTFFTSTKDFVVKGFKTVFSKETYTKDGIKRILDKTKEGVKTAYNKFKENETFGKYTDVISKTMTSGSAVGVGIVGAALFGGGNFTVYGLAVLFSLVINWVTAKFVGEEFNFIEAGLDALVYGFMVPFTLVVSMALPIVVLA